MQDLVEPAVTSRIASPSRTRVAERSRTLCWRFSQPCAESEPQDAAEDPGRQDPDPDPDVRVCGIAEPAVGAGHQHGTGDQTADVDLTLTEYNIVHRLAEQIGDYVSYRAIYDCVHHAGFIAGNGDDGYRTNVRSSMKRIRNKFRAIDADFVEIENFPAFGYRWRNAPETAD